MSAQAKKTGAVQKVSASAKQKSKTAMYAPVAQKPNLVEQPNTGSELLEAVTGILRCNLHSNLKIEAHSHVDGFSLSVATNSLPDLDLPMTLDDDQIWPDLGLRKTLNTPLPGQYWEGQGGYYAGLMVDGNQLWYIILSDAKYELTDVEWGKYPSEIKGDFSRRDGRHNTALVLSAEPDNKAAQHVSALLIDGHKDFYWPAQHELDQIQITCPQLMSVEQFWSSTQYSANNAWVQDCEDGYTDIGSKGYKRAVRAVRRISANLSIK